jgi:hypothetical protein
MKTGALTLTLAAVMACSGVASAQPYGQSQTGDYQSQRDQYDRSRSDYQSQSDNYDSQREAYERERERYETDQRAYDARYGRGSYERSYGVFHYEDRYDNNNDGRDDRYADDRYRDDRRGDDRYRDDRYYEGYRNSPCERSRDNRTGVGGVIGALAGAAIGSNVAGRGVRTEGAILGAVVGGVAGGAIGRSTAACDNTGYYYSYNQTYPYREGGDYRGRRSGRYDYNYYSSRRCRLAVAPAYYGGSSDNRYVRVCPDRSGRYRITE